MRFISLVAVGMLCVSSGLLAQTSSAPPVVRDAGDLGLVNPGAPDLIVSNEIVVLFDATAASQIAALVEPSPAGPVISGPVAEIGSLELDALAQQFGVSSIRQQFPGFDILDAAARGLPDLSGFHVVTFDDTRISAEALAAEYLATPGVLHAEVIGVHPLGATPNDGNYATQWHLNQANDKDMDAPEAWNIETGDPSAIVAVLDSGVRYYHKDLGGGSASSSNPTATAGNIWINTAEKNGVAGVDDDGNGYVDDWVGWDFVTGVTGCWSGEDCSTADNDPRDFNGHGTHCSGLVGAINNNGYAVASPAGGWGNGTLQATANGSQVMSLRIGYSASYLGQEAGFVRMDFAASALYYAANKGCRIASCSWGSSNSGGIASAVSYFVNAGGLIFKAAGNSNSQTADYLCGLSTVYCVASTDQNDVRSSFSNYGTWVDISAPGSSILSTYHDHYNAANDYVATLSGTSMATPLVASTAAAVWSRNPTWTAAQVWAQVRDTADNIDAQNPSLVGRLGSGRVNLYDAVNTAAGGCGGNAECDDGDPCNGAEVCVGGDCVAGAITDCNGNGQQDSCDIGQGISQDCNGNGVPDECESNPCPSSGAIVYMTFSATTSVPGVGSIENEDIVAYDVDANAWSLYFDGSDVGLSSFAVDALALLADGSLLISVDLDGTLTGLTGGPSGASVDDSDLVRFTPTSLGASTAGAWSFFFDGSDVGLTATGEDIDALGVLADGRLIVSTTGNPGVTGLSGLADEDLLVFNATAYGAATSGAWGYYFDGSDVGLADSSGEDIDGVGVSSSGALLITTVGSFSVTGASGSDEDVLRFVPTAVGSSTAGSYTLYLDLSALGIATGADVRAICIVD